MLPINGLVPIDEHLEIMRREVNIAGGADFLFQGAECLFEVMMGHSAHHVAEHVDETAIGVIGKPHVACLPREPLDGGVVEAEVEHRVHHTGHGDGRAAAHGNEQRVLRIAEACPHGPLDVLDAEFHLLGESFRPLLTKLVV